MKAKHANNKNSKCVTFFEGFGARAAFMMALAVVVVLGSGARAQDPEIGNVDSYAPDKTVQDYQAGVTPEKSDFDYSQIDLRVGVWLDHEEKEIYQRGEEMGAGFQTNQDAYAVVYRIDADGLVNVLWPRSRMDNGFVFGGHEYLLPVAGAGKLLVSTSEGEGFVEAIVSKYPFDLRDLEIDFHHESTGNRFNFLVAGDPFLAMNEVNFAVTGLENSEEYVVTNYASYYVHQEVDHPRYLCNQCHVDEEVAYDPYQESCTLEISYDYGWVNSWYDDYGYYPVYANPVYVYVDPWTWRPWVNFWYWPSYTCAPYYGYGWYGGACYSWGYSPYYGGNCYTYNQGGYTRYRPLTKGNANGAVTKTREYGGVSRMVDAGTPDSRQREAMASRTRLSDQEGIRGRSNTLATNGSRATGAAGVKATRREQPNINEGMQVRGNSGLRIRDGASTASRAQRGTAEANMRHRAGGSSARSAMVPVQRTSTGSTSLRGTSSSRTGGAVQDRKTGTATGRSSSNSRSLKPAENRSRGTRVWNSGRTGSTAERSNRTRQVRPGSSGSNRSSSGVKPRSGSSKKSSSTVNRKSSSTRSTKSTPKSSGKVGNNSRSKSSSGGSRSSGGGSRSSGGGSRSSGGKSSSGSSRGGGSSQRR